MLKLDAAGWPATTQAAISDFWLEQSAAYAAIRLAADDLADFEAALRKAQSVAMPPKLLAVLCTSGQGEHDEIGRAIADRAGATKCAPTLLLAADDQQRAFEEIHAAIEAMQ